MIRKNYLILVIVVVYISLLLSGCGGKFGNNLKEKNLPSHENNEKPSTETITTPKSIVK